MFLQEPESSVGLHGSQVVTFATIQEQPIESCGATLLTMALPLLTRAGGWHGCEVGAVQAHQQSQTAADTNALTQP